VTKAEIIALAERVERLDGADREVDALVSATVRIGTDHEWANKNYPAWVAAKDGRVHLERNGPSFEAPRYTASLDVAMGLVPDNWWVQHIGHCRSGWRCRLETNGPPSISIPIGAMPCSAIHALALTAAALRAIAASMEDE
jgi:hypothetical protein